MKNPPLVSAPSSMAASSGGTTEKSSMTRMIEPVGLAAEIAGQGAERDADRRREKTAAAKPMVSETRAP